MINEYTAYVMLFRREKVLHRGLSVLKFPLDHVMECYKGWDNACNLLMVATIV
jgi:hypothetical protein